MYIHIVIILLHIVRPDSKIIYKTKNAGSKIILRPDFPRSNIDQNVAQNVVSQNLVT